MMQNTEQPRRPRRLQWILFATALALIVMFLLPRGNSAQEIDISQVIQMAEDGQLERIEVVGDALMSPPQVMRPLAPGRRVA